MISAILHAKSVLEAIKTVVPHALMVTTFRVMHAYHVCQHAGNAWFKINVQHALMVRI